MVVEQIFLRYFTIIYVGGLEVQDSREVGLVSLSLQTLCYFALVF